MCQRARRAPTVEGRNTRTSERASSLVRSAATGDASASPRDVSPLTQASAPSGSDSRGAARRVAAPVSSAWYTASSASSASFLGNRK